ncbi:MAG TPA: endonuclease/exonuclease/phosphatase family protein [Pyrinomonadaceae bacterium]|jgi:endonuclease/exonuclease/phosphatase family metal-dependent hydrolase|nr:endonuclease/exonuclease/phosphatase family protein [Pyrinomonadaceae bacterium]
MIELSEEQVTPGTDASIEMDSFASPPGPTAERPRLVIASYNIRYAVGSYLITGSILRRAGLSMPARRKGLVARHLRRAARALSDGKRLPAPDIVALQEADKGTARAGGHHVARELARALRMSYAHAPACLPRDEEPRAKQWYLDFEEHIARHDTGDTGVALLSRFPVSRAARVELPWTNCAWRPRLALETVVAVGTTAVYIYNTHIDPHASIDEQLAQHEAVLRSADEKRGPTILLGDFNTLTRVSCARMRAAVEAHGYRTPMPTRLATWRAGLIRLHTDWIFVRGAQVRRWGVARRLGVSDHWPVWVELALG